VTDERARLFVALELPATVRTTLTDWRSELLGLDGSASPRANTGLRPVPADGLHVTLCFLGWRAISEIVEIAEACAVVADDPPAELKLGDAVWLPKRRPRVLAVSLEDSAGAIARAQARLSEALQEGGWYVPEARPFLPHVTVGRVIRGARVGGGELPQPPAVRGQAQTVTLYRSRLGAGGARYESLHAVELGAGGRSPEAEGGAPR
jgi:RNA 2',3'-cyclic 3'-phosphodiesterase